MQLLIWTNDARWQLGYENGSYQHYEEAYPVPLLSVDNESHYMDSEELKPFM